MLLHPPDTWKSRESCNRRFSVFETCSLSIMILEVSVALIAVLCLRLLVRRVQGTPAPPSFPQVPGWPLIGSLIELRDIGRLTQKITAWAKVYGEDEGAFEFTLTGNGRSTMNRW